MSRAEEQGFLFDKEERPASPRGGDTEGPARAGRPGQVEPAPIPTNPAEGTDPPEDFEGKSVWVIDAHSLIHQVFHALPEMSSPRGEPVGAVFGFARDIFTVFQDYRPDYLFCAFDLPGKTFRHELYEKYKIHRPPMPDDLVPQIAMIRRLLEAMEIQAVGAPGFEADDVLATIAEIVAGRNGRCFLVTADKDCRQLINDRVKVVNMRKKEIYDAEALLADWGIRPDQVVDFQAMVGDSVDNVPGVPLIGPKIAKELLQKYETLESVLDHAGEISGKKRKENLLEGRAQAMLSRDLVRLDRQVPVAIDWNRGRVTSFDKGPVLAMFDEFGFRRLAQDLAGLEQVQGNPGPLEEAPPPKLEVAYRLVESLEMLDEIVAAVGESGRVSVDTETTSTWPRWAELVGVSLAWKEDEAWYIPVRSPEGELSFDERTVIDRLRPVLENPGIEKVGQNLKYDMIVLRGAGLEMAGPLFDTMVADYLLDSGGRNHGLDSLARRYLEHETIKISELIGTGKNQRTMDTVPLAQIVDYAAEDAIVPLLLRSILKSRLESQSLLALFTELEMPLIETLVEMEFNGITVDRGRLAELSVRYQERMDAVEVEIYALAGRTFNIGSPKQLQEILFDELHLPVIKKGKTGPSTDAEVLEELAAHHPLPAKIVEHRRYAKLKNTYVDAIPELILPKTGRVHASFNQVVTATGRLSSSDPNLQNIPVRTRESREIRSAFIPRERDWVLVAADYSQIELRMLAHFSKDEHLLAAFRRDEDIHARVAAQVNGIPIEEVTAEMRRAAKAVNFGIIYGQSAFGLAKQLGIEKDAAGEFIKGYFVKYPGISEFLDGVLADCRQNGYVKTILGRRRFIRGIRERIVGQKNLAERTAINTVIQGSAADLIKQAMIAVLRRMRTDRLPGLLLLQIHDELIFETPSSEANTLANLVVEEMSRAAQLEVPLKVDVKIGPNWADAEPWPGP